MDDKNDNTTTIDDKPAALPDATQLEDLGYLIFTTLPLQMQC